MSEPVPASSNSPRPRRTKRGWMLRILGGAALGLLLVWAASMMAGRRRPATTPGKQQTPIGGKQQRLAAKQRLAPQELPSIGPAPAAPAGGASPALSTRSALSRQLPPPAVTPGARALALVLDQIVVIRSNDDSGEVTLGAGFVVDRRGLVATNYHVLAEATEARAVFQNGTSYDISGYVAVDPQQDLAVIQLRRPPPTLAAVRLRVAPEPSPLAAVVAVGHPSGLDFSPSDGRVSRMIRTSELPQRSRQFLREIVRDGQQQRWIQHTASISPGSSGGPLLNQQGEVIGINTWVDVESRFGYALHVQHLRQMLEGSLDELQPLARFARPSARVAALLRRLSGQRMRQLFADAEAMQWLPKDDEQYETLQQLAWSVTAASMPSTFAKSGLLESRMKELITETSRIRRELGRRRWDGLGQVTWLNDFAARKIRQPMAGLVLFATVQRVVSGSGGRRGMLMQVSGLEQTIYVPLDAQLEHPPPGASCLVLGVNYDGHVVRYGDNPLDLIVAPVVVSEMLIPIDGTG